MAFGFKLVDPYKNYTYETCTADTAALYINDPVKSTGAEDTKGRPVVTACAAGNTTRGICVGLLNYTVADILGTGALFKNYKPAGVTDMSVLVCSDPDAEYYVTYNGTPSAGNAGSTADMVYAAGSQISGISGCSLSTTVGTSSAQFMILRQGQEVLNNTPGTANSIAVVRINKSELKSPTAGV